MERRDMTAEILEEDEGGVSILRPGSLSTFVGQEHLKGNLRIFIEAAKKTW